MNWYETDRNRIILADVITKIWQDLQSKEDFITEPKKVLQEAGIDNIPKEIELRVIEDTPERQYIVLPLDFSTEEFNGFSTSMQSLLPLKAGKEIVLVQNTANLQYIPLPTMNSNDTLSIEELESISGGGPFALVATVALAFTRTVAFTSSSVF